MYQIGCIIGAFVFGILAYYFGRRAVFMVGLFIFLGYSSNLCYRSYPLSLWRYLCSFLDWKTAYWNQRRRRIYSHFHCRWWVFATKGKREGWHHYWRFMASWWLLWINNQFSYRGYSSMEISIFSGSFWTVWLSLHSKKYSRESKMADHEK